MRGERGRGVAFARVRLNTSYRQIFQLAYPIMIGSAAQNAIAATDSIFLYHLSEIDFAAIGFVSTFYLIVAAVGYGFSKAGQILIARRMGGRDLLGVRQTFQSMLAFEVLLAGVAFAVMQLGAYYIFASLVDSDAVFYKSLEFIETRSWGVFASYAGIAFVALYSGVGRTNSLLVATVVLLISNGLLNYALIFGHFGLPSMGIAGAGLASTIAEYLALITFLIYVSVDREIRPLKLLQFGRIDWPLVRVQARLSLPVVLQSVVGLGSWLVFFGLVDNLGERALAVTNLVRVVYLAVSIPAWGFATTVNTMTSHFLGRGRRRVVRPLTKRVAYVCVLATVACAVLVASFPKPILYPLFGGAEGDLVDAARPVLWVVVAIMAVFSYGVTYFNSLIGAGGVWYGLKIQTICALSYMLAVWGVIESGVGGVAAAWATELLYWGLIWYMSARGLTERRWRGAEI